MRYHCEEKAAICSLDEMVRVDQTKPHVVTEHAMQLKLAQEVQPIDTGLLIRS